jgi:hypothetical protein
LCLYHNPLGPEVKFKGVFHPIIISPDRIEELGVISQARDGEFLDFFSYGNALIKLAV